MTNAIYSTISLAAPFVRKPARVAVAVMALVIAIQPTVAQATTMSAGYSVKADLASVEIDPEPDSTSADVRTIKEVLVDVCAQRGYGEQCAKHLLGMAWKETNFIGDAKGDYDKSGFPRARGWFQIWYQMHKISVECAEDLRCSANWTISYLQYNDYDRYPTWAIQCHNGCGIENGYAASVKRHSNWLWDDERSLALAYAK